MWRKLLLGLFLFGLLVGVTSPLQAQENEKSYSADRFDVDVFVNTDGSIHVTETVVFNFVGGPFTFVFRELPTEFTDGIVGIEAAVDGRPYPIGDNDGEVEISGRDPLRVEYHFEPTSNRTRTYTLSYRMLGVVRQEEGADLLIYQPLPDNFEYSIARSTVTISYPGSAQLLSDPVVTAGQASVDTSTNRVTFVRENLAPNQTMVIQLPFVKGSLISAAPEWQQNAANARAWAPSWFVAAAAALIGGLGYLFTYIRRVSPRVPKSTITLDTPPGKLSPAMAGMLTTSGISPGWPHALSTLFDLADRGVLEIEEKGEKKWYQSRDYTIRLLDKGGAFRPHERGFLDLLFARKNERLTEVDLSELRRAMSGSNWKKFTKPLKDELREAGFISKDREKARSRLVGLGVVFILLSLITAASVFPMAKFFGGYPLFLVGAVFVVSVAFLIAGISLNVLTDGAAELAADWQRFFDYLKQVTKNKAPVADDVFDRYLPYAAAAGLLVVWVKWFDKQGWTQLPGYFKSLEMDPQQRMGAFIAFSAATHNAGGSAAGGAAGAGAGAAGGGASGAG